MEPPFIADPTGLLPDVQVGDVWHYRNIDGFDGAVTLEFAHKVVDISENEIITKLSNARINQTELRYFTREWNSIDIGNVKFEPFFPKYEFPLHVGKRWNREFVAINPNGSSSKCIVRAVVAEKVDVTVPAGTFKSFRIVYDNETFPSGGGVESSTKGNVTIWFAPEIANAAKSETITIRDGRVRSKEIDELVKYVPAHQRVT